MIKIFWLYSLLVISMVLFSGCSWFSPSPLFLPTSYQIGEIQFRSITAASLPVILVADNQLHNLYGNPVPILRTSLIDEYVPTAIRPVPLDFYGQDFLEWVVKQDFPTLRQGFPT